MRITELQWDDHTEAHILAAHGLYPEHVEEVVFAADSRVENSSESVEYRRHIVSGRTMLGLYLVVVLEARDGANPVVTARRMTPNEEKEYRQWVRSHGR